MNIPPSISRLVEQNQIHLNEEELQAKEQVQTY